eukprot:3432620-Prymnesium_polylepis.1
MHTCGPANILAHSAHGAQRHRARNMRRETRDCRRSSSMHPSELPLGGCGPETARSYAFEMGWGVNVNRESKCLETTSRVSKCNDSLTSDADGTMQPHLLSGCCQ